MASKIDWVQLMQRYLQHWKDRNERYITIDHDGAVLHDCQIERVMGDYALLKFGSPYRYRLIRIDGIRYAENGTSHDLSFWNLEDRPIIEPEPIPEPVDPLDEEVLIFGAGGLPRKTTARQLEAEEKAAREKKHTESVR